MRLVFLDVDGVLNNKKFFASLDDKTSGFREFDRDCVKRLNVITENSLIVISSCWRNGKSLDFMSGLFYANGVTGNIVGLTPTVSMLMQGKGFVHGNMAARYIRLQNEKMVQRADEIMAWFICNSLPPEAVESIVILDDDSDMGVFSERLVLIEDGLTDEDVVRSKKMLKNKSGMVTLRRMIANEIKASEKGLL